jgi:hypothetical protein
MAVMHHAVAVAVAVAERSSMILHSRSHLLRQSSRSSLVVLTPQMQ